MIDGSGPATAILLLILILGIVALATGIILGARRRRPLEEAPPEVEEAAPEVEEAPPEAPPPVQALPEVAEVPPPVEPVEPEPEPEPEPVPVEAPPPPVEIPARGRVRSIGASIRRLFGGSSLTPEQWEELEEVLLRADVGVVATGRIVAALRARADVSDGMQALRAELLDVLGTPDRALARKTDGVTVWLVTGVNGVGKTTTIGKLASQLTRAGSSTVLAAADTFRAAADEQLQRWAEAAGAEIVKHSPGADPAAVVFDAVAAARARGADALIVDTAGRLQNKRNLMEELTKIRRVLERESGPPDEVLLVLDATTGQNAIAQARAFSEAVAVTGLILTKLDGTARGGIVIAVQQELGIPVKMVGLGEGIDDLAPFDPEVFVDDLLRA
ncbi:MAG: signal recognition particle-docking protein FtsY [Actinomycetota bacterium]